MTSSLAQATSLAQAIAPNFAPVFALCGALAWAAVASAMVVVSDVRRRVIPNRVMAPALLAVPVLLTAAVLLSVWQLREEGVRALPMHDVLPMHAGALWTGLLGGVVLATVHLVLAVAGGIGGGDVKLALFLGIVLGFVGGWEAVWWGGVLAWGCAGFVALVKRVARAPDGTEGIPFAPCLVAGSWAVILAMISASFLEVIDLAHSAAHSM